MRDRKLMVLLLAAWLLCAVAGLCFDSTRLDLWAVLTGTADPSQSLILWQLRLPRVLAGILAGIGLSAARAICENLGGTLKAEYPTVETIRFTAKI